MKTVTSHVLNGVDGSNAGGVPVRLVACETGQTLAEAATDDGGRLSIKVPNDEANACTVCHLVFDLSEYWQARGHSKASVVRQIILQFELDEQQERYHMPVIAGPYQYSTWKSG